MGGWLWEFFLKRIGSYFSGQILDESCCDNSDLYPAWYDEAQDWLQVNGLTWFEIGMLP